MGHASLSFRIGCLLTFQLFGAQAQEVPSAELKSDILEAFSQYIRATEARINKEISRPDAFLYIDGLSEPRRLEILGALKRAEIRMAELKGPDSSSRSVHVPHALIHHWIGAMFVPGASLRQALDLAQDYNHHQDVYKPEVVRSRLISRNGDDFKIYYRLRKKKLITVTLDTNHDVHYTLLDPKRCHSRSYSTRIVEVENADRPDEREKPVGHDSGFLWRLNSYWRFAERDGGVYVECESVSLTRDVPVSLAWLIKPFITGIPKESLEATLGSMRSGLLQRVSAAPAH